MLISACSPLRILNVAVWRHPYHLTTDLAYGTGHRQRLDVYVPKHMAANPAVVIFFSEGAGSRATNAITGSSERR